MNRKTAIAGAALGLLVTALLGLSLDRAKTKLQELFMSDQEIAAARAEARAAWRQQHEDTVARLVRENWGDVAATKAVAVSFENGGFQSAVVNIGEVATAARLDLVAFDYRCGYCRADVTALRDMIRDWPGRKFIFLEAAILGPQSLELAKLSLAAAKLGKFPEAHEALFELSGNAGGDLTERLAQRLGMDAAALKAASVDAEQALADHLRLAAVLGIRVTPTYILDGSPRIGALRR